MNDVVKQMAVIRAIKDRLKFAEDDLRASLMESMDEGDAKAAWLDDVRLGRAWKVGGNKTPTVVDERALVEWVKKHRPDEIVETVRSSFAQVLLDSCRRHGMAVYEATGEVVPGIDLAHGAPYIKFKPDDGTDVVIAARWRELVAPMLELEDSDMAFGDEVIRNGDRGIEP